MRNAKQPNLILLAPFLALSSWSSLSFKDSPKRNFSPRASRTLNVLPAKKSVWFKNGVFFEVPPAKYSLQVHLNLSKPLRPSSDNLTLPWYSTFNAWMCQSCAQCTSFQLTSCKDGESQCLRANMNMHCPRVDGVICKCDIVIMSYGVILLIQNYNNYIYYYCTVSRMTVFIIIYIYIFNSRECLPS